MSVNFTVPPGVPLPFAATVKVTLCPYVVVYLDESTRGAATAEALTAGALIGELGIPVFLYGDLATDPARTDLLELWCMLNSVLSAVISS